MDAQQSNEPRQLPTVSKVKDVQDLIDFLSALLKKSQYHRSDDVYILHGKNYYELSEAVMIDDKVLLGINLIPTEPFEHEDNV